MPESRLSDLASQFPGYNADSVSVSVAQQLIRKFILPITDTETLPLKAALGRVLASDVVSFINVPAHDNSAMDGYAFCPQGKFALATIAVWLARIWQWVAQPSRKEKF